MRSVLLLLAAFAQLAAAQVPLGEYVREYSPGYAGESLTISADSSVVLMQWSDIGLARHPSLLYRKDIARASFISDTTLHLTYAGVVLDTVEWRSKSDWLVSASRGPRIA